MFNATHILEKLPLSKDMPEQNIPGDIEEIQTISTKVMVNQLTTYRKKKKKKTTKSKTTIQELETLDRVVKE